MTNEVGANSRYKTIRAAIEAAAKRYNTCVQRNLCGEGVDH